MKMTKRRISHVALGVALTATLVSMPGIARPASAQAVNECDASVQGPFISNTQILGIAGHRVGANGYAACDTPVQVLALAVSVWSVGAGMSGTNPYTRLNTDSASGYVEAGFAGETLCYMATAETAAVTAAGDAAASGCDTTDEPGP